MIGCVFFLFDIVLQEDWLGVFCLILFYKMIDWVFSNIKQKKNTTNHLVKKYQTEKTQSILL
jgi:hypothetical protein